MRILKPELLFNSALLVVDNQGVGVYDEEKVIKILSDGVIHDLNGKTTPFIAYTLALEELDRLKKTENPVRFITNVDGFVSSLISDLGEIDDSEDSTTLVRTILNQKDI